MLEQHSCQVKGSEVFREQVGLTSGLLARKTREGGDPDEQVGQAGSAAVDSGFAAGFRRCSREVGVDRVLTTPEL